MFTPHFEKLNIFLSWKGKAIGLCPSGRSLTKRKWSWNLAIQDRILYLDDVIKPDRDTVIMHTSQLLAHAVLSSVKGEWWCFSSLYFKAPAVTYYRRYKNQPATLRWEKREHEVHLSGFTIELHRKEKTLRKAKETFLKTFKRTFKKVCPAGPVFQVGNDSSTTVTKYGVNAAMAVPLRYQLTSTECIGEMWHK